MRRRTLWLLLPLIASLSLTACGSGAFSNPFIQQINVTLTPSSLELSAGGSGRTTVTGVAAGTTTTLTGLTVTASEVPTGLSVTTGTGGVTVTAAAAAQPGTYAVPLEVTQTGGKGEAVLTVTIKPPVSAAGYAVTFDPTTSSIAAGASLRLAGTAKDTDGNLRTDVHITSITGALKTAFTASDPLGFTIQTAPSDTPGSYVLLVNTSDGTNTLTTPVTVTVTAASE